MRRLFFLLLAFQIIAPCSAHDPQLSSLKFIRAQNGAIIVSVSTHESKLRAFEGAEKNLDAAIRRRLKIRFDGQPPFEILPPPRSHLSFDKANDLLTWQAEYSRPVSRIEVLARLYPEDASSRLVVAVFDKGRVAKQAILSAASPTFDSLNIRDRAWSTPERSTATRFGTYTREGIFHIFSGWDHVCFVLGLLLLGGSLKAHLKTISAFTLAHSITLSLAILEIYAPSPRIVEPLIALSIVAVAIENLRHLRLKNESENNADWRPILAFGFGLIHGFGFAGALAEIGLPRESLGWALASFNIGVELGQATIVLAIAPALAWLARASRLAHNRLFFVASIAIGGAGVFWFFQRIAGG